MPISRFSQRLAVGAIAAPNAVRSARKYPPSQYADRASRPAGAPPAPRIPWSCTFFIRTARGSPVPAPTPPSSITWSGTDPAGQLADAALIPVWGPLVIDGLIGPEDARSSFSSFFEVMMTRICELQREERHPASALEHDHLSRLDGTCMG